MHVGLHAWNHLTFLSYKINKSLSNYMLHIEEKEQVRQIEKGRENKWERERENVKY